MIDWNSYRAESRIRSAYIHNPRDLHTVERCAYYDGIAARYITGLQAEIENMKQYRAELYERMRTLYTAPSVLKITLRREKRDSGVKYYLTTQKIFADNGIEPETVTQEVFQGKQRAEAIKAYHAAVKAHPGILCEMNIEKGRWER